MEGGKAVSEKGRENVMTILKEKDFYVKFQVVQVEVYMQRSLSPSTWTIQH